MRVVLLISLSLFFCAWLDPVKEQVDRGNEALKNGKLENAEKAYDSAYRGTDSKKEKRRIEYNQGVLNIRQKRSKKAEELFKNAATSKEKEVQKRSLYNLGTHLMNQGRDRDAAGAFMKALSIDPSYEKAKKNLEYLLNKKKNKKNSKSKDNKDQNKKNKKKDDKSDNKKNKDSKQNRSNDKNFNSQKQSSISKEQVKRIMEKMKSKPVRRREGGKRGTILPQKYW